MDELQEYFEGKPESLRIFQAIEERIAALGPSERSVRSQVSFGVNRKFAWFWLYNVTKKNRNGIPHLMLALDRRIDDPHVREITQIGRRRWNHQIVIRSLDDARSDWLADMIEKAYDYGSR